MITIFTGAFPPLVIAHVASILLALELNSASGRAFYRGAKDVPKSKPRKLAPEKAKRKRDLEDTPSSFFLSALRPFVPPLVAMCDASVCPPVHAFVARQSVRSLRLEMGLRLGHSVLLNSNYYPVPTATPTDLFNVHVFKWLTGTNSVQFLNQNRVSPYEVFLNFLRILRWWRIKKVFFCNDIRITYDSKDIKISWVHSLVELS